MKRLIAAFAALAMLSGGGAPAVGVATAEAAQCCWLYCEAYRDTCVFTFREDREYCNAWYEGCIDGCQYPGGPTSGGGGAF